VVGCHSYGAAPELGPGDPGHGNGKRRNVNVDDMTFQSTTSIHHRGAEDAEKFNLPIRGTCADRRKEPLAEGSYDQPLDTILQHRDIEIDQQTYFKAGQFQVRQCLGLVDGFKAINRLQF
jgi:hypothetical protein